MPPGRPGPTAGTVDTHTPRPLIGHVERDLSMQSSDVIVLSPPGAADPSLAIAACRAGAWGFLDLEHTADTNAALAALRRLQRFAVNPFGVKLGRHAGALLPQLLAATPARLAWVLVAGGDHVHLQDWVAQLRQRHLGVLFEAASLAEARLGERLGVDGLVLKGHEAGGRVGAETAFILLQNWMTHLAESKKAIPVWVQGGVGLNTAAACVAGGAAGAVLDAQVLLAREAPLGEAAGQRLAAFDGSETQCLGERLGEGYRVFARPGWPALEELTREEERIHASAQTPAEKLDAWRQTVRKLTAGGEAGLVLLGQDAATARPRAGPVGT